MWCASSVVVVLVVVVPQNTLIFSKILACHWMMELTNYVINNGKTNIGHNIYVTSSLPQLLSSGHTHERPNQCDQNGLLFKCLCDKFFKQRLPKYWATFLGYFENHLFLSKNGYSYFLGKFWDSFGYFLIYYLVTLNPIITNTRTNERRNSRMSLSPNFRFDLDFEKNTHIGSCPFVEPILTCGSQSVRGQYCKTFLVVKNEARMSQKET